MKKNNNYLEKPVTWPLFVMALVFGLCFAIIFGRLIWIQVIDSSRLKQQAEDSRVKSKTVPAQRGGIFDRDGIPLALSVSVYNVVVDPLRISYKGKAVEMLVKILGSTEDEYVPKIQKNTHYSIVAKQISQEQKEAIEGYIASLPKDDRTSAEKQNDAETNKNRDAQYRARSALRMQLTNLITFELDYQRHYPQNSLAAQTIGWVRKDIKTGQSGIEMFYDDVLKGAPGASASERDVHGNLIPSGIQREIPATAGQSIMLTIDSHIQAVVEKELKAAAKRHKAKAGFALVIDPKTGEILASASYPTFNINSYNKADEESMRNRALVDLYEPGSTLKCMTVAYALESGAVKQGTKFGVPDSMKVGVHTVRDASSHAPQSMTTTQIIEQSSNVGTSKIAFKMGKKRLNQAFQKFGITTKSNLDFPGTTYGRMLKVDEWLDINLSNYSFGQGVSMTPVMLARTVAAIANDGVMTTPHLLKEAPGNSGLNPPSERTPIISKKSARATTKMLRGVMTKGTGKLISVPGYTVAGKTGTAQKAILGKGYMKGKFIGSFIGYLPAQDPQVIILVGLDEPVAGYYGATVAGTAFSNIAQFCMSHLEIASPKKSND